MLSRLAIAVLVSISIGFPVRAAHALNLISLTPLTQEASLGESVAVTLLMQFDESTLGGGVDLLFDESMLAFVSFDFDPGLGDDPGFRLDPTSPTGGNRLVVGFGDFNGIAGSKAIGTATFDAVGLGLANLSTAANVQPAGPFVSAASPLDLLLMEFEGGAVTVVPEPSTLGLLILGSGGLFLLGSKAGARRTR
jgi:hypothetical protein